MQIYSIEDVKAILDDRKSFDAYGGLYNSDILWKSSETPKFCETAINIVDHGVDGLMRLPRQPTEGRRT